MILKSQDELSCMFTPLPLPARPQAHSSFFESANLLNANGRQNNYIDKTYSDLLFKDRQEGGADYKSTTFLLLFIKK